MRSSTTFIGRRVAGAAAHPQWCAFAALLLVISASGCTQRAQSVGIAPRLTPTADTVGVRLTMAPVARLATVPVVRASGAGERTIRIPRHSYGPGLPPEQWPLLLVNGVALGLRSDGTIDPASAQRLLQQVNCRAIVSIEFVKSEHAVKQFGRAGSRGAFLIVTASDSSRERQGEP